MGVYYDGTTIGNSATTGTGGGAQGKVTSSSGVVTASPGWQNTNSQAPIVPQIPTVPMVQQAMYYPSYQVSQPIVDQAAQIKAASDAATAQVKSIQDAATAKSIQDAAALKPVYDNQLQATINPYKTAQANIPAQTATLNNQASSTGMVNAQHIRNALAQMGLLQSGESASQQLTNDVGTANNINANNLAGQQLDASYNDKIAAATAQNALDYNNAVTHASEFAQTMGLSQAQLANTIAQQGIDNVYKDNTFAQAANQFAQQMGLSQAQYASGLDQWAKTFSAQQVQNNINNAINSVPVTGRIPDIIKSSFPSSPVTTTGTSGTSSSTGTTVASLPSSIAAQYPGATNVTQVGTGYKFNSNTGSSVYWVPPLS